MKLLLYFFILLSSVFCQPKERPTIEKKLNDQYIECEILFKIFNNE
jgi:hypothetical protein